MKLFSNFKIFRAFGVDVYLNPSWFVLLFLFVGFKDATPTSILVDVLCLVMIFTFVTIHEFGHILAGRQFGVGTDKVVLSLLGGVAYMKEGLDKLKPLQAIWVAFAGPLTNIIIGAGFFLYSINHYTELPDLKTMGGLDKIVFYGIAANLMMVVFNLIPIYPMDGGRLLRSTMELFKIKKAKLISTYVSSVLCIGLLVLAVYLKAIIMGIIAVIFFVSSWAERVHMRKEKELEVEKDKAVAKLKELRRNVVLTLRGAAFAKGKDLSKFSDEEIFDTWLINGIEDGDIDPDSVELYNEYKDFIDDERENTRGIKD